MTVLASFRAPARGVMQRGDTAVSGADLAAAAGAIEYALFNDSTGSYWRMPAADQAKIGYYDSQGRWRWATVIDVVDYPTAEDLALVGVTTDPETGRRDRLLGLFTGETDRNGDLIEDPANPPQITIYAGECAAAGYDLVDVTNHETGHRLRYNDEHAPSAPINDAYTPTLPPDNPCPGCAVDEWLATAERALYSVRERAHMQHRIPDGMGGRIPEARARLKRAQAALSRFEVLPQISSRHGEIRNLRALITAGQVALEGDTLEPQDISRAHAIVYRAWDANVDLGHAYQVALRTRG